MSTVATFSEKLLAIALQRQASDIHFSPFSNHTNIYFRINGKRIFYEKIPNQRYQLLLTYYKFSSGMDIGETRKPQNGTMTHIDNDLHFSLRLSTLPVNHLESLAIRILPQERQLSIDELFLFPNQLNTLKKWIQNRAGLILITGPTGSGKTTMLYALLESILKEKSYQAITLEDPIEKDIDDILQVQVNEKAGITYQVGLKAALRHDPDIIMIGEIRDRHTARFALEASLTGHLVLSTLHAKNTVGTIYRLREMGLEKVDLLQSIIAIAAIQLLPIEINHQVIRRAAILEILDGKLIEQVLEDSNIDQHGHHTFERLRKKAFAYGFISENTYQNGE